ncbi:MAG: hypothetical protein HC836_47150 [Richelia sp. RM2_1_2]|nr:hypothetical protein [Richelia sp. RM2_1_2]
MYKKEFESKLRKLTLTLFAFHLRNELTQSDKPEEDANLIWEWCENLGKDLNIKELEGFKDKLRKHNDEIGLPATQDYPDSDYLELLKEPGLISFSIPNIQHQIKGAVYPLQIHDINALDISLSSTSDAVKLADLNELNPKYFHYLKILNPL